MKLIFKTAPELHTGFSAVLSVWLGSLETRGELSSDGGQHRVKWHRVCCCVCVCVCSLACLHIQLDSYLFWTRWKPYVSGHCRTDKPSAQTKDHLQYKAQSKAYAVCDCRVELLMCGVECLCVNVYLHKYMWQCPLSHRGWQVLSQCIFRLVKEKVILKKALYCLKCHAWMIETI